MHYTLDIPSFDDYHATIYAIRMFYFEAINLKQQVALLFKPHNEHRIFLSRLSSIVYYDLFGKLNFRTLILYQNLYLLAAFGLTLAILKKSKVQIWPLLLPISLFLFSLSFWQVTLYYWGGIQYYTVFFFIMLSLYWLVSAREVVSWQYIGSMLAALIAIISFGNGILVVPLALFLLWTQKKYQLIPPWIGIALLYVLLQLTNEPAVTRDFSHFRIDWAMRLFFTYLGSFAYVSSYGSPWHYTNIILCMVVGAVVFYYWIRLLWSGYAFKTPLLFCLLCLPILTGVLIAISRFDTKAAGGIAPRYMFFTAFIPIWVISILYDTGKLKKNLLLPLYLVAGLLWSLSYTTNSLQIKEFNQQNQVTLTAWLKDKSVPLVYYDIINTQGHGQLLQWAIKHDVYQIPPDILEEPPATVAQ
ncbi:hypothetical protein [Telluribacter sp. SYSU D00476]|uniref:hypothetical protein n=1 Tax=Telluribacter sp. SYSU D00476 TaxID=2811430 RepID=UPI001FF126C0|nr:hypothetical protein [Telluribacter sp. SYSU D00476]